MFLAILNRNWNLVVTLLEHGADPEYSFRFTTGSLMPPYPRPARLSEAAEKGGYPVGQAGVLALIKEIMIVQWERNERINRRFQRAKREKESPLTIKHLGKSDQIAEVEVNSSLEFAMHVDKHHRLGENQEKV